MMQHQQVATAPPSCMRRFENNHPFSPELPRKQPHSEVRILVCSTHRRRRERIRIDGEDAPKPRDDVDNTTTTAT